MNERGRPRAASSHTLTDPPAMHAGRLAAISSRHNIGRSRTARDQQVRLGFPRRCHVQHEHCARRIARLQARRCDPREAAAQARRRPDEARRHGSRQARGPRASAGLDSSTSSELLLALLPTALAQTRIRCPIHTSLHRHSARQSRLARLATPRSTSSARLSKRRVPRC